MTLAAILFSTFVGRRDIYAVASGDGFRPSTRPLTVDDFTLHVQAKQCFGFYVMQPGDVVVTSAIDFDGKHESDWRERATSVADWLRGAGLDPIVEVSQSGTGAHVWLFFSEPIDAWVVRAFWRWALRRAEVECREIFPKQDRVTGKGLGNLIRYPLWRESRFVDSDWNTIEPDVALDGIARVSRVDLCELAARGGAVLRADPTIEPPPASATDSLPQRVIDAISYGVCRARWLGDAAGLHDPSKSGIAMSFACSLIKSYVPTPEIEIALRVWCDRHGAHEKGQREDWIRRTVANAYDFVIDRASRVSGNESTMLDATLAYLASLEQGAARYTRSGIPELDASIDGIGYGEMCLVGARPSHGKSAFGIQWADVQSNSGTPVLFISEEMNLVALGGRCASRILHLDESKYSPDQRAECEQRAREYFAGGATIFVRQSCRTVERAVELIEQHVASDGVRAVVIDYTQLLKGHAEKRNEDVGQVSIELRHATTRLGIAMVALCQLNREIDKRDRGVRMSDIGDSGQLERDADLILFVRWPWKDGPFVDRDGKEREHPKELYKIQALKRRNGPIRNPQITTTFNAETQTIGAKFVAPPGLERAAAVAEGEGDE